jgi:hypothetical protein
LECLGEVGDLVVLRYEGPATKAAFEVHNAGYANIYGITVDGGEQEELHQVSRGPFRGRIDLPAGPTLIHVDCLVSWTLAVTD